MEHRSEQSLQPEDELQYIRKIITESRASVAESGEPYIVWGLIVALGIGVSYLSVLLQRDLYTAYVWAAIILFGWGSTFYFYRKERKREPRAHSLMERMHIAVWTACGSAIGISLLLILSGLNFSGGKVPPIPPFYVLFVVSLILAIAYYLSGISLDLKWLRNLGFAWLAGAIVMFLWPSVHMLALYGLMLIFFQVIPGIILQRRYRRITQAAKAEG